MSEQETWRGIPLTPDVKRFIDATRRAHMDERAMMLRFAPILCTCTPWYDYRNPEAAQVDCMVHTTIMFDEQGGWQ